MNIPFQAIHFMAYEFWQQILNPDHKYDPRSHLIAGGLAGGLAAAVTTPLDCIKTVLNTQQTPEAEISGDKRIFMKVCCRVAIYVIFQASGSYRGFTDAAKTIYSQRGLSGFSCGLQARVIFQVDCPLLLN